MPNMTNREIAKEQAEVCASFSDKHSPPARYEMGKLHGYAGIIHALLDIADAIKGDNND